MTTKKTAPKKAAPKKRTAKKTAPRPVGRPSDYRAEYAEQAYKLCLLGFTDKELADFYGVSEQTLNAWKQKHPKFLESLLAGKEPADAEVAASLYHRAKGYSHPEDKVFNVGGEPLIVPTIKHYPPDTQAASLWLRNRQTGRWRDKVDVDHGVQAGSPLESLLSKLVPSSLGVVGDDELNEE